MATGWPTTPGSPSTAAADRRRRPARRGAGWSGAHPPHLARPARHRADRPAGRRGGPRRDRHRRARPAAGGRG
ncbi:hypothetical protein DDE19_26170, partial [Micromonospora ureilytica]